MEQYINTAKVVENKRENIPRTTDINELLGKEITVEAVQATKKKENKSTGAKQPQFDTSGPFFDDFNMGPKPDWNSVAGDWTMANGKYTVTNVEKNSTYLASLEGKKWGDLALRVDVSPGHTGYYYNNIMYQADICPRMINHQERICFGMSGIHHNFQEAYWYILKEGGAGEAIGKKAINTPKGQAVHVRIEVKKGIFTAYINDAKVSQIYDTTFPLGSIGLSQWYKHWKDEKIRIVFDNLEITPLSD